MERTERGDWVVAISHGGYKDPLSERVDIFIGCKDMGYGRPPGTYVLQPLEWKELEEGIVPGAALSLEVAGAQSLILALFDAARKAGLLGDVSSTDEVAAIHRHLEDMRRLVFKEEL